MAKFGNDQVMDAALDNVINNADQQVVCAGQPSTYADATTDSGSGGNALGEVAVASGDFTKADGDTDGRKFTLASKDVTIDVTGTADHVALVDDNNSVLLMVTTMSDTSVTVSESRTINAWDYEVGDPA